MRMSQQAFGSNTSGQIQIGGALNQSMGRPMQSTGNSSMELNNSVVMGGLNNTTGGNAMARPQQMNSKNANKQYLNTSFDASKSANTINYVNSAYMSNIPQNHAANSAATGIVSNTQGPAPKISKVGLKAHGAANSRQPQNMYHAIQGNNYTDGSTVFMSHN